MNHEVSLFDEITAEEYLNLSAEEKAMIENIEIAPPILGKPGFGKFKVKYITPVYRDLTGNKIRYPK